MTAERSFSMDRQLAWSVVLFVFISSLVGVVNEWSCVQLRLVVALSGSLPLIGGRPLLATRFS